ncbi:MAG: CARDB domain-containing protein [Candidatus Thalassarchaeaceae archaeon]|nr:CARDB domain-containing protein [Candidatus Thalassarchaeaceae archaeon]
MRCNYVTSFVVTLLLFAPATHSLVTTSDFHIANAPDSNDASPRTTGIVDVPDWRINDNWMYDGYLDVAAFVASSGVSTNVETLDGTLEMTVVDIYALDIGQNPTLVYEVESIGEYESSGTISLDGISGCLFVDMDTTETVLASDLSTYTQEATIDVYFDPYFFGSCRDSLRVEIGVLTVSNTFNPPLEALDFPINVGEFWQMDYQQDTNYSGNSAYVDIPEDSSDSNTTSWEVVSQGSSGVSYPGCSQSYNITSYDSDGQENGFNWYCPAISNSIKSTLVQGFGFTAVHELVSYQPVQRGKEVSIDIEYPLSPTDIEISGWVNVTDQGQPVSNQTLQFRYESEQTVQNITTDQNGSYQISFNSGSNPDNSVGPGELGSHGLVAWIENEDVLGSRTLLIDSDVHEIDLVTRSAGVTVQRLRANSSLTLDPNSGFTAILGDTLTFSVPILNRGLLTSPSSSLAIHAPDGTTVMGDVPPLGSLEESRIELNWTVPGSQSFGNVYLDFVVDPSEQITEDGNRTNNVGSFVLYIGTLPVAVLDVEAEALTLDTVTLDGSGSQDPDGGSIVCEFSVERSNGEIETSIEDDCVFEWSWNDDGEHEITLSVMDEENDNAMSQSSILIHNRPPEVTLSADSDQVVVTTPITFRVENRSDVDTQNPSSPVDILWGSLCDEGRVGMDCTVTPMSEGQYTIELLATDDDGATTQVYYTITVTNAPPTNPVAEVWLGPNRLATDSRGVYFVNEGDAITLMGQADDSSNDLFSLMHIWSPDAEEFPELNQTSIGRTSTVNYTYNYSGMHLATLLVLDDDMESTEMLVVPIQVENLPPSIGPIPSPEPVDEDEEITIETSVVDTPNDMDTLTYCFDTSPSEDVDLDGDSANDCDIQSHTLVHSWPDASTAPEFIVFHVTDDDGDHDSVEIPILVTNAPPTAMASTNSVNPTEGGTIVLSANGTIDSQLDMDSLQFHWDVDIAFDSDGDGNPANDVDFTGRWIEFTYDSSGLKQAKLTVMDESSSHSVTMEIDVADAPASLSTRITSNPAILALLVLALVCGAFGLQRFLANSPDPEKDEKSPVVPNLDFDDAPENEDPEPPSSPEGTSDPPPDWPIEPLPMEETPELGDVFEELTGHRPEPAKDESIDLPQDFPDPLNGVMEQEDIEALFEE